MHTSNEKHREFEEQIRALGCPITGATNPDVLDVYHLEGRTFKHNKQLIGPYLCVALYQANKIGYHVDNLHMYGPYAYHSGVNAFEKNCQSTIDILCFRVLLRYTNRHVVPWNYDEWDAIKDFLK